MSAVSRPKIYLGKEGGKQAAPSIKINNCQENTVDRIIARKKKKK